MTEDSTRQADVSTRKTCDGSAATDSRLLLKAGFAYFAIVFAIGFILGLVRVPLLAPVFGDLIAVLIELPIILALAWLVCRHLVLSLNVPPELLARAVMGGSALLLLLGAELALGTIVSGGSIIDHLRSYSQLPQALGLAGQVAFGLLPLIQSRLLPNTAIAIPSALGSFIPDPDIQERFAITVRAPAHIVYEVASEFDMQSPLLVRAIFWLRAKLLRSSPRSRPAGGLIEEMRALGWGFLVEREGEIFAAGAVCEPWQADVVFTPLPPDQFLSFSEPAKVKIAWMIATSRNSPVETSLVTETRAIATDPDTRWRFLRYWRWARFGIIPIRWILLPAIRKASERRWGMESESASDRRTGESR